MRKSKIKVTIAGKATAQPCHSLATPNDFGPTAAVFFSFLHVKPWIYR
jgi:hypothetical protein